MKKSIASACVVFTEAAAYFLLPLIKYAMPDLETVAGYELILLPLIVFPTLCYISGAAVELIAGASLLPAIAAGALFLPASFLHYGNLSPTFAAVYAGACLAGEVSAYPFRVMRLARKEKREKV